MEKHAMVATSEISPGAEAFRAALTRKGFTVSYTTLSKVENFSQVSLFVDRNLPPYDLPAVNWGQSKNEFKQKWWNSPDKAWKAWSKCLTAATAIEHELSHPGTIIFNTLYNTDLDKDCEYVSESERAEEILDTLGHDIVVKPDRGMLGRGVTRANNLETLIKAMRTLGSGVIQEFLPEASTTLRLVTTRHKVIASYARKCAEGDWRGNVATGASVYPLEMLPSDTEARLAVKAVNAFGLDVAGVDIVQTSHGPVLLELNPAFGVGGLLKLYPDAIDCIVEDLYYSRNTCSCGESNPHDAWACN